MSQINLIPEEPITIRAYIKIADTPRGYKLFISDQPDYSPVKSTVNYTGKRYNPTISFPVEFKIQPNSFNLAKQEALKLNVMETIVRPNGSVI
ncbi:MAG: hypothetical protein KCHDKBKB_00657 [Elusimicrobia bacterium]|nr:hypothetical protein [Elusimicrobiota bacterium]